jgi:hypothetical protein
MRASQLIEYIHGQGSPLVPINLLMRTPREDMISHVGSLLRRKFYTRVGAGGSGEGGIVQTRTANLYRRLVTELLRLRPQPNIGSPPSCLNEAQREAWLQFAEHGRLVMTGGPGTGKTFVVKQMLDRLDGRHLVTIAAPTARAAALFKPALGDGGLLRVGTVHSVLKMAPGSSPAFDLRNPLPSDVVIVDECSMMDLKLMVEMLEAAPFASILLVGDPFQLPPVNIKRPFEEIISSSY